jgi:ABC-type uncharacterized transport system permease subunit
MGGDLQIFLSAMIQTLVWTVLLIAFGVFVWKRGTKLYSATGM